MPSVRTSPFKEHPFVGGSSSDAGEFDVQLIDEKFNLDQYCNCLLNKIQDLNKSKIKPFIKYQCDQVAEPLIWLNKLEKLIDLNRDYIITTEQNIKTEKVLMIIELLRQEIENNKFYIGRFNFQKVKNKLKTYSTTEEQLSYLYETQAEYLQNRPRLVDPSEISFDEKVQIEIKKIMKLEKLKVKVGSKSNLKTNSVELKSTKIKINGRLNILLDSFYQMYYEKKTDNGPYLDVSVSVLVKFLANNFVDKDGHSLSENTIRTVLNPNKPEKRPKASDRVQLY